PGWEDRIDGIFEAMEEECVEASVAEGADPDALAVTRRVDARYRGQSFELRVPAQGWEEAFHDAHEERYGYRREETPVEAVTLRVLVTAPGPPVAPGKVEDADGPPPLAPARVRVDGSWREGTRVWREDLGAGHELEGPCLVLEYSSTTWLPPGWTLEVDLWGCLHLLPGG
ncbi:MAG TPA: hypothetical protein VLL48_07380, partial [Longimicrobiales bacterium]|nr:hypothetical protein [Longimicrobiales bacterium]